MRILFFICIISSSLLSSFGQDQVWVLLEDKGPDAACLLENPIDFLSPSAVQRRLAKQIPFTTHDLPVYHSYQKGVSNLSIEFLGTSKWLNAVAVSIDPTNKEEILALDYVKGIRSMARTKAFEANQSENKTPLSFQPSTAKPVSQLDYGQAELQNTMLKVEGLHERGFTGKGVKIAIMDAGFRGVDKISAFDSVRASGRILATYDFVKKDTFVYGSDAHGTQVMSVIGGNIPGQLVGTAPQASFMLFITENRRSETRQEEYNWMKAMEMADSLGADVIHTSLGYSTFDSGDESYTYENMDGETAITTLAAEFAARKGIIVTASAGNERGNSWGKIVAPCDGDSVLCIGALDQYQNLSSFSSIGPSADGRVKPDVVAMGTRTKTASSNNRIYGSNGTSFSAPLIAGFVACLRQAHPERSNIDIIQAVRLSGDQYALPDEKFGYGIPNAVFADSLLANVEDLSTVQIVMSEKPSRGRKVKDQPVIAKPKPTKPVLSDAIIYTLNPETSLKVLDGEISIDLEKSGAKITSMQIFKGKQKVLINNDQIKNSGNTILIKTKYLLEGKDYHLDIKTDKFEEKIPFKLK